MCRVFELHDTSDAVYPNGWGQTLYSTFLILLVAVLLVFAVATVAAKFFLFHLPAWAWALFALCVLGVSEGGWFGLTCRRFAQIEADMLTLYGAFGRIRWQGGVAEHDFYYSGKRRHGLTIMDAKMRVRRFSLRTCANHDALLDALSAKNSVVRSIDKQLLIMGQMQHERQPPLWVQRGMLVSMSVMGFIGLTELSFRVFWSVQLTASAWGWGAGVGLLLLIPWMWFWPAAMRRYRSIHLPARHYWRKTRLGNAAAEIRVILSASAIFLPVYAFYVVFAAYNLAWLSLAGKTYHAATAYIAVSGKCYVPRGTDYWEMSVRLPQGENRFDGQWCSGWSEEKPPPRGMHEVYWRESRLARELLFSKP